MHERDIAVTVTVSTSITIASIYKHHPHSESVMTLHQLSSVEVVVQGMQRHIQSAQVQDRGASAIFSLAVSQGRDHGVRVRVRVRVRMMGWGGVLGN